jgi:hypothetical protein
MATIIVKRQPSTSGTQDLPTSLPDEREYPSDSYEAGLVSLGKVLLMDDDMTEWLTVRKVSGICRNNWKYLLRLDYSVRTFSDWARGYLSSCGETRGKDLRVRYKTEPSTRHRDPDQFLQFVRVHARV